MDSTSYIMTAVSDIIDEWTELKRRGNIILHMDGNGVKNIEFNYHIDFKR